MGHHMAQQGFALWVSVVPSLNRIIGPVCGLGALGGTQYVELVWLGTLLGPEGTPGSSERWVFSGRSGRGLPNASLLWVVVVVLGWVWLWVECCIVDASILLWSSC